MTTPTLPACPPPKHRLGTPVTNCFRTEITLSDAPARVFAVLREVLPAVRGPVIGWPVRVEEAGAHLTARYRVYLFLDTLEAVVEPDGGGSRLVVRSTSHLGRNDFGVNRRRVERLLAAVRARLWVL